MYCYSTILLTIVLFSVLALSTKGQDCNPGHCAACHHQTESGCSCCPGCNNPNGLKCDNGLDTTAYRGHAPGVLNISAVSELGLPSNTSEHISITVYGFCRFCNILSFNTTTTGSRVVVVKGNDTEVNLCRENAEGFLCSQCSEGFYHNKGFECVPCDNLARDWSLYLLSQLVSMTVMFFILYITNFSIVAGGMNAAIFFAQMVTTTMDLRGNGFIPIANVTDGDSELAFGLTAVYQFIYGPWNLDFFTPFVNEVCLFHKESYLYYFIVEYLLAFYPLILVSIVTFIYFIRSHLCQQCKDCLRSIGQCFSTKWKQSSRNILASFLVLSYTKFGLISINAAAPNKIYDVWGKELQVVSYFDATVKLYSPDYLAVFVIAVCAFSFLGILPIFLILLRYEINGREQSTKCNWIDVVLEPYQKHFKDHCNKRDCKHCNSQNKYLCKISFRLHDYRWVPAIYFVMRLVLLVISALAQDFQRQFIYQQIVCIIGAGFILFLQPYKNDWLNKVEVFMLLLLAFINTLSIYQYYLTISGLSLSLGAFIIQYVLIFVPALWIAFHVLCSFYKKYCLRRQDNTVSDLSEENSDDDAGQRSVKLTSTGEHDDLINRKKASPNYEATM